MFTAALDYMSATVGCITGGSCTDDMIASVFGVAMTGAGVGLHYYSDYVAAGGASGPSTGSNDLVNLFSVGEATMGPKYRTVTVTLAEDTAESSDQQLYLLWYDNGFLSALLTRPPVCLSSQADSGPNLQGRPRIFHKHCR